MSASSRCSHELDNLALYGLLDEVRRERGLSWYGVSREVCVHRSFFGKLTNEGRTVSSAVLLSLFAWLGDDLTLEALKLITRERPTDPVKEAR